MYSEITAIQRPLSDAPSGCIMHFNPQHAQTHHTCLSYVPETPVSKPSGIQLRYSRTSGSRLKMTWSPEFSASSTSALAGVVTSANPESGMAGEMAADGVSGIKS